MRRKIIKLAEKTLVVSLPSSWVSHCKLEKGDEVEVLPFDGSLSITPVTLNKIIKKVSVDIFSLSERVLRWQISSLHKQGYDEIELLNYSSEQETILVDLVKNLFVGFMVKEKSSLRIVVSQVAIVDSAQFVTSLRQAFRHLVLSTSDLSLAFANSDSSLLSSLILAEKENNKLTNLCERLLNKSLTQKDKGHFWYVVAWNLEKIFDNYKYIASYFNDAIISLNSLVSDLLSSYETLVKGYYDLFYAFSFEKLVTLANLKDDLHKKCLYLLTSDEFNSSPHQRILVHYIDCSILQIADLSASTIALMFSFNDS
jgi:phosphate uptake regulator